MTPEEAASLTDCERRAAIILVFAHHVGEKFTSDELEELHLQYTKSQVVSLNEVLRDQGELPSYRPGEECGREP